jgi:NAD(P)-dependent dehydrogenase (short-subunit alcohol dehydrogenase family)
MNDDDSSATSRAGSRPTLVGRAAIITGASRGIGAATARAFVAAGAAVALAARDRAALSALAEELSSNGGRAIAVPTDVAAVVWLCSDQAPYITGATVPIDGGKLAGMAPFRQG